MKKIVWTMVLCLVILSILNTAGLAADKTITLSTLNWEPYIGEDLKNNGYVAEIAREALAREGYNLEIKFYPWARTVKLAKLGKVDGYFPEYYSAEKEEQFVFSDKFPGGPLGFFKKKGRNISYDKLENLKSYTIGVVRGYVNTKEFDNADYLQKEPARSDLINIRKLLAGRIDLMVADKFVGKYVLKENLPNKVGDIEFVEPPLEYKPLYVAFGKNNNDYEKYAAAFNRGLQKIKEDGTLDKILAKHGF